MLSRIQYYRFISIWCLAKSVSPVSARGCQMRNTCLWNFVKMLNSLHTVLIYDYMSFINQYIFQFSLDECFYQFTGRKLAGVLQYLSTSGSLIQLESWRVFKFATGSIVHLLAKFMVAVLCYIFEFWYPWVQLCWIFLF